MTRHSRQEGGAGGAAGGRGVTGGERSLHRLRLPAARPGTEVARLFEYQLLQFLLGKVVQLHLKSERLLCDGLVPRVIVLEWAY